MSIFLHAPWKLAIPCWILDIDLPCGAKPLRIRSVCFFLISIKAFSRSDTKKYKRSKKIDS